MRRVRFAPLIIAGLFLSLLAACGSDNRDDVSDDVSLSGTAAVGLPVVGATVTATCADGSTFNQTVTTNAQGVWSGTTPSASLPCVLQLSGGTVNGEPSNAVLHSLAINAGTVNITPLTDLALALSVKAHDGADISDWFDSPANWSAVSSGLATYVNALEQALVDAGFTLPQGEFDPLTHPFNADQADPYDVLLDSLTEAIANSGSYSSYEEIRDYLVSGGTLPLPPDDGGSSTPDPEEASGLGLVAIYKGTWTVSGSGHSRGTVIVSDDGATIDFDTDKSFAISGADVYNRIPQFPSDPRVQIEVFEEGEPQQRIRIYIDPDNTAKPLSFVYYPSATTEDGAIEALVELPVALSPNGDGAALAGGNGATGTVNGTVYTFDDNVGFLGVNTYFTAIDSNVLNKWEVAGFGPVLGTQSCASDGDHPMVRLALNGVMYAGNVTGGECVIEITSVSSTEVEGRFAARLADSNGNTFATVTDGYFRYAIDDGETTVIGVPDGETGIALTIDDTSYLWQVAPSIDPYFYTDWYQMSVTSANTGPAQAMYIFFVPKALGTYSCGSGQPYRKLNAYVRWDYVYYNANETVGDCSLTVTRADTTIEGTFSGTFVSDASAQKVVTNGSFRFISPY